MNLVFWIHSNCGVEVIQPTNIPDNFNRGGIQSVLEEWGFRLGQEKAVKGWLKDGPEVRKTIQRYEVAKANRSKKVNDLIAKKITPVQFEKWLKKNEKVLEFPFKA